MSDEWKSSSSSGEDAKSWKLLEKALLSSVQEQRRSRRWGIFFKLLTFIYLFGALALVLPVEAQTTACAPRCLACEMAAVMPRSLNEPVGFRPSYLT